MAALRSHAPLSVDSTVATYNDVSTRFTMVGYGLRLGVLGSFGDTVDRELMGLMRVVRSQDVRFHLDEREWHNLRFQTITVADAAITAVGRSAFTMTKEIVAIGTEGRRTPVVTLETTAVAVDASLRRSIPLPSPEVLRSSARRQVGPPGKMQVPRRRPGAFCLPLRARWTESDSLQHINQAQYGIWMEEARAAALAAKAFAPDVLVFAALPPTRMVVQYEGQAVPGDEVNVFTWWNGDSFGFEVEKAAAAEGERPVLTRGQLWVDTGRRSKL